MIEKSVKQWNFSGYMIPMWVHYTSTVLDSLHNEIEVKDSNTIMLQGILIQVHADENFKPGLVTLIVWISIFQASVLTYLNFFSISDLMALLE
jgi:hypothetical protein